jgi:S1-C subfamily serine protease
LHSNKNILKIYFVSLVAVRVLNECSNRVYRVHGSQQIDGSQIIGTGVQFEDKHILTAAHLKFDVGKEYDFCWKDGQTLKATCIYKNDLFDFAILKSDSLPNTGFAIGSPNRGDKFVILVII